MLKEFYDHFKFSSEYGYCAEYWEHRSYETPYGVREELVFQGNESIIQKLPSGDLSLLLISGKQAQVLKHTSYLLLIMFKYLDVDELRVALHGVAYQAVIPLKGNPALVVEDVYATGTIERVDRFNNSSEKEVSKLVAVVIRRNGK